MKLRNKITGKVIDINLSVNMLGEGYITRYDSLEEFNEEWEDYEEPKGYWFIDCAAPYPVDFCEFNEDTEDDREIGNYFETKEEAEKAIEKLKAWKRLKEIGFKFTNWEFRDVLDGELVIEAKIIFHNDSNTQRDLEICFGGEE